MRAKVTFLVIAIGMIGCSLLALRQQRLDTVHALAVAQRDMAKMDQDLYRVRIAIARTITPQSVVRYAVALGPLRPIGVDPVTLDAPTETAVTSADPGLLRR